MKKFIIYSTLLVFFTSTTQVFAQPAWTFDVFGKEKKPEKYEEKLLTSEKTGTKKFGAVRRFFQNTTSHYNFFFNANTKINAVIERAKISNKDDYTKLLSFYPYSLENTASQKTDLDSVIYKATAGILLHDLRSEWVDNFYLLIGKSFFYRKEFDSAALTFQFINYNLYPRKKKNDDDDKIVGSNVAETGKGSVSIANEEKRNLAQKLLTRPPSRNEALIWQIRTFIEQNELGDAAGLISILQNDQNLPLRLQNDLSEITAYWFYVQNNFDSAAVHLEKGLSNAANKEDKSRSQFLIAQLYENSGNYAKATEYYAKVTKSTADVVMDVYARLNSAKMYRNTGDKKALDNSIDNLLSMARKDKFEAFRDIIYYSAAQLTLQRPDTTLSIALFKKSIAKNTTASSYKDKSFLQLGNIAYTQGNYKDARSYYDSVSTIVKEADVDSATVLARKEVLARLVPKVLAIEKEDSLQLIAAMPLAEREAYVKKLAKIYRKEKGLKEEDFGGTELITFAKKPGEVEDLFRTSGASSSGQWYFYNTSLRAKGFNDFKSKWGKRTNADNWRRKAAANAPAPLVKNLNGDPDGIEKYDESKILPEKEIDYSYAGLMGNLPLTAALLDSSNSIIANSIYDAAQIFQNELQDYEKAINLYENFLLRFKNDPKMPDVYLGLSFCYAKMGNTAKADMFKNLLKNNFATSNAAKISANPIADKNAANPAATSKYEAIYNKFIEGDFENAIAEKRKADSVYGNTFWNPQLLYIEAVYYIKTRKDSNALATLKNIVLMHSLSPLKDKALNLISVLGRRAEIEKYLTDLQVTRAVEEQVIFVDDKPVVKVAPAEVVKIAAPKPIVPLLPKRAISDSIKRPDVFVNKSFVFTPDKPHYVVMLLDKVDGVYVTEAKNALERFNKESMTTASIIIKKDTISSDKVLLLFSTFDNAEIAMKYFDKLKKVAPSELSWLQANKYSFLIIADDNLQLLKTNKDLSGYKELLIKNLGNKF